MTADLFSRQNARNARIKRQRQRNRISPNPSPPMLPIQEADVEKILPPAEEVFIVGGGPSLRNFNFSSLTDKCTITVNKSVFHVPNPNYFISVDYTFLGKVTRKVFHAIPARKFFVADFSHPFLQEINKKITDTRFNLKYNLHDYNVLIRAQNQEGIGYTFEDFRTGRNSGFCAFQLAIILGFKRIYLLGIDLNKQSSTHYHEGYGERAATFNPKLDEYYDYFEMGLEQLKQERPDIHVFSCSLDSRLNDIISYRDVEWIL